MTTTVEEANAALRQAVGQRINAAASGKTSDQWYDPQDDERPWRGDALLAEPTVHHSSQAFFDLCDELKEIHRTKSIGYGSPDDPLANIRNGAHFVGIEPWRAAMVRLSDKVTRLQTYCRTGSLPLESFEDNCVDLASYALLTLLMHREEQGRG